MASLIPKQFAGERDLRCLSERAGFECLARCSTPETYNFPANIRGTGLHIHPRMQRRSRMIEDNRFRRQPFQHSSGRDMYPHALFGGAALRAVPLARTRHRYERVAPCIELDVDIEAVIFDYPARRMQDQRMADRRSFRIQRFLYRQRSTVCFRAQMRATVSIRI